MANFNNKKCFNCPYHNKKHLKSTNYSNGNGPLSLENNNSNILLVFQSPGVLEWQVGKPLQSKNNKPQSAASRINNSWKRCGKKRSNYDITNAIQCYPGKYKGGRDKKPRKDSIESCLERLKNDIKNGQYRRIIAFGNIAKNQVNNALVGLNLMGKIKTDFSKHPSGGVSNKDLDNLW